MKTLLIVLLLAAAVQAQDFKFLPWKYDRWNSTDGWIMKSDKAEHAIRDGFIFWALGKTNLVGQYRFGVTTVLATGWEIRDGFRWRHTDGFSWKDLFAGMAGQVVVFGAEHLFDRSKPKKYDEALQRQLESDMRLYMENRTLTPRKLDEALRKASEATLRLSTDGVSIPCPDGIAGCAVNHVILKSGVKDASSN